VGTGKGTGVGAGTGGGPGSVYPPAPTELFLPPLPVPNKAKGTVIVEFDVDSTGKVIDLQFTPTKDGSYNRKLREALVAIRFRPAVDARGNPIRAKAQITYSL
jgi:TonB family protein